MYLSLHNLRKIIKSNKSAQGSLIAVVLGSVLLATIVASGTSWYLAMRNNLGDTEEKLEAQTIAQSEWERLSHMSLDELEANRETFKIPYSAGTGNQFTISVNLGQKGTFNNGTCGAVSGGYANCFQNTTITVYQDGNRVFTTRTLPLMAGDYTRKEIDSLLASMKNDYINRDNALKNDYTSKVNNLTTRLNSTEFIKNKTPSYDLNLRYEKKAGEGEYNLHAYNGNTEIPLASLGGGGFPDINTPIWSGGANENEYLKITTSSNGWGYNVPASLYAKKDIWCKATLQSTSYYSSGSEGQHSGYNTMNAYTWYPVKKGTTLSITSLGNGSSSYIGIYNYICYPAK